MHHAIDFNHSESGIQASDLLDMSQFHKISFFKCSHREPTEKLLTLPGSDGRNMPNR